MSNHLKNTAIDAKEIDCLRKVAKAGHGKIVRDFTRLMFGDRTKQRTLWISGVANSGKSMFIRRVRNIFASHEVEWRGQYNPVREQYLTESIIPQIVSSEEFNFKEAFADGAIATTKLLMEGAGMNVRNDLFAQFKTCYKDAIVVIASNKLPASEAQAKDSSFHQDVWTPLTTRVKFVYTGEKHDCNEDFPYTTGQLAKAIGFLVEHEEILKKMEKIDNIDAPTTNEESLLAWSNAETTK